VVLKPDFLPGPPSSKIIEDFSLSRSLFFDLYSWVPMYPIIKTFLTFPFPPFPTWLSEWVSVGRTPPPRGGAEKEAWLGSLPLLRSPHCIMSEGGGYRKGPFLQISVSKSKFVLTHILVARLFSLQPFCI